MTIVGEGWQPPNGEFEWIMLQALADATVDLNR
jgi:hypothetical protein